MPRITRIRVILSLAVALILTQHANASTAAVNCQVIPSAPPTDADIALLNSDYEKAVTLYRASLAQEPKDPNTTIRLTTGLVHALLHQQKIQQATDAVKSALAANPNSAALLTLRGEVELRDGRPWDVAQTINDAYKLDPCNARNHLLLSRYAGISSLYATAREQILIAHKLAPNDPEIRSEWMHTLPLKQRIAEIETYLASPNGEDAEDIRHLRSYLEFLKNLQEEPHKPCRLVSSTTSTKIPFASLMRDATHLRAYGLEVKLNNKTSRLQIDTGAGGLVISRSVAEHAGLKSFSKTEASGIGSQGPKSGYTAFADSIRIGDLEFQDCSVHVIEGRNVVGDVDGLIGMDVFSQFLVTLDYPMRELILGPLPPRPGEAAAAAPTLQTNTTSPEDSDNPPDSAKPDPEKSDPDKSDPATSEPLKHVGAKPEATPKPVHKGPFDRYIAPEMKDYTRVYRVGHQLILPAALNQQKLKLFIMDTGSFSTTISPEAAREVTKIHKNDQIQIRGISGKVNDVFTADEITFSFAHISQKARDVVSFETSHTSKALGMEISGFIGANTLNQVTIHIDYRDGLVKFDYDPNRGYRF